MAVHPADLKESAKPNFRKKGEPPVRKSNTSRDRIKVVDKDRVALTDNLAGYLSKGGQLFLPMVELIEQSRIAVDELLDTVSRAAIEAILVISASEVAGSKQQGRRDGAPGAVGWYGTQRGRVDLAERRLTVRKPRLRTCGPNSKEVEIPAYSSMQDDDRLGQRMAEILMRGVSTRSYDKVLPEMADTVSISKSNVSREFIEASTLHIKELMERRLEDLDILIIYVDGMVFGNHHLIVAIGVDGQGYKHVLGVTEGATENATVVKGLLENLQERGVVPDRPRLFVIDGSKALRKAIDQVYGSKNLVQRCRKHKMENVCAQLPEDLRESVQIMMRAAYKLPWKEGITRLKKQAQWLAQVHPHAATSLLEGLEETFTINRFNLSPSLRRSLGTTNIIESPNAGIRRRTRRVCRWRNGEMVLRWAATALIDSEKSFNRLMGYRDLWMLKAALKDLAFDPPLAGKENVA